MQVKNWVSVFVDGCEVQYAKVKEVGTKVVAAGASIVAAGAANAAGPDFSSLTSALDLSTTITAVMAIGLQMFTLYVAIKGTKILIRELKSM